MHTVVTEELRSRSGPGRKLVEGEEDVELVTDVIRTESQIDSMIRAVAAQTARAAVATALRPPTTSATPQTFELNALSGALADASSGLRTTELIRRERAEGKRRSLNQPDVDVFLSWDFHSMGASRFLFSSSTDADGCALNRGSAWSYAIPNLGEASSSSASSDGAALVNLGQIIRLPSHGGPAFTPNEQPESEQPAGPVVELVPLGATAREVARREGGWIGADNTAAGSSASPLH